jgi:equilibrative nucleoside transporter 1/2/3
MHSLGDFVGRFLAGFGPWSRGAPKPLSILLYSLLRCGVAAAVLFCHLVTPTPWLLDEYLSADYWPAAVIFLLGATQVRSRQGRM